MVYQRTQGLYWFGQNVPMSSLLLLVLLVPKRFVVEGTNGQERDGSQVSDGKVERTPRSRLLLGCLLSIKMIGQKLVPLVGCHALPFIDQGGAGITYGRKGKNQRVEEVL